MGLERLRRRVECRRAGSRVVYRHTTIVPDGHVLLDLLVHVIGSVIDRLVRQRDATARSLTLGLDGVAVRMTVGTTNTPAIEELLDLGRALLRAGGRCTAISGRREGAHGVEK
jgi:hypothetical protein